MFNTIGFCTSVHTHDIATRRLVYDVIFMGSVGTRS